MKSFKEILRDINLIRLSGSKDFILAEFNGPLLKLCYMQIKEHFYYLDSRDIFSNLKIIESKVFIVENEFETISVELENFIESLKINNPILIIGINDYKFTAVSIPSHIESADGGEENWFSENSSKFLPEGSLLDSFAYSYEKIKEDENYKYFILAVARKDYVNKIRNLFNKTKAAAVFPFVTSISALRRDENENILLIDFTGNKIGYSFCDSAGNLYSGDLYSNLYDEQSNLDSGNLNPAELFNSLIEIKNFLSSSFPSEFSKKINLFVCCTGENFPLIEKNIKEIFDINSINKYFHDKDPFFAPAYLALNKFVNNYGSNLTLLGEAESSRNKFEKQAGSRIILSTGFALISLLVLSYLGNFLLSAQSSSNENIILQAEANLKEIEILEKENSILKSNLSLVADMKENRSGYPDLLFNLSRIINSNCRLTELEIDEINPREIKINLKGLSRSQNDAAEFIRVMENDNHFKNVSLINISAANEKSKNKDYMEFKLTADYYVIKNKLRNR